MRNVLAPCFFALAVIASAGCDKSTKIETGSSAPFQPPSPAAAQTEPVNKSTNNLAVIKTSAGEMVLEFWPDVAPNTVSNFLHLARSGFYDGTCFHRIMKGFMIQGGDPLSKDPSKEAMWGTGDPGYKIKAEFNSRSHQRGVVSMARSQDPDSAGCQFFICHGDAKFLDGQYTAFAKLKRGDEVLEKIANTPCVSTGAEASKPTVRVNIDSIKIVAADSVK